jgi:hypothetical protein
MNMSLCYVICTRVGGGGWGGGGGGGGTWWCVGGVYGGIAHEVNVSVSACVEIKGDYIEK